MERDFVPRTLAAPVGEILALADAAGRTLGADDREKLLADLRGGSGPSKLTIDAVVFRQDETPNRNFVRFKPAVLRRIAKTFEGVPFLRDHEQRDLLARGGKVISSEFVGGEGKGEIRQRIELVKPWAIEGALDGTIDRFSIGWNNTADVVCSICDAPFTTFGPFTAPACAHMPGDEIEAKDGSKRRVEMVVTGADGVEVSAVSVPAVLGTGIDSIRAALAAERVRAQLAANKEKHMKTFAAIAVALALSEDAVEADIVAGIRRLRADNERITALHAAEAEAHAAAKARVVELDGQLATVREAEKEAKILGLLDATRRKVGQKLGADGKPERGGTAHERAVLQLAARDLKEAEAFVNDLPTILPIGGPLLSRGTEEPRGKVTELTAQQKNIAKKLKLTEAQYLAQLSAQAQAAG